MKLGDILNWINFGRFADILGVLSVFLTFLIYLATKNIKKAIISHDELKRYREDIKDIIKQLSSLHLSMKEDRLYNEKILTQVAEILSSIQIQYASVIKDFSKKINKLENLIYDKCIPGINTSNYRQECIRKLGEIIERLKKEASEV